MPINHLHPETAGFRVFVQEVTEGAQTLFAYHRVRIEQQHILACAEADGLVVGFGKARILLVGNELYLWKARM